MINGKKKKEEKYGSSVAARTHNSRPPRSWMENAKLFGAKGALCT